MFKKILKIVSIVLAGFVVVVGAATGIYALTGGFKHEEIPIISVFFDDSSVTEKNIYTLEDVVCRVDYYPDNATSRVLNVEVIDQVGVLDNAPTQVLAGQDFTLKINKDDKGNNIGGYVNLKFTPAGDKKSLGSAEINLFADVAVPDKSLFFTGDNTGKITASGKQFSMAMTSTSDGQNPTPQYIYLKSSLVNAFNLKDGDTNLKPVEIEYSYYNKYGVEINTNDWSKDFGLESDLDSSLGIDTWFYKIPVYPTEGGTINIKAKMHRTYEIAKAYAEGEFDNLIYMFSHKNQYDVKVLNSAIAKYSEFINKYIKYFDTTAESYKFFSGYASSGKVSFSTETTVASLEESMNYVFVNAEATVNVVAVQLKDVTSTSGLNEFLVTLSDSQVQTYDVAQLVKDFDIKMYIGGKDEEIDDSTLVEYEGNESLYSSMNLTPYLYISQEMLQASKENPNSDDILIDERTGEEYISWLGNRYDFLKVYGFTGNTPNLEETNILTGYFLKLEKADEIVSVVPVNDKNNTSWKVSYNVPLIAGQDNSDFHRAIYFGFEIQGIDLNTNQYIYKETFSRISINYQNYVFKEDGVSNIELVGEHKLENGNDVYSPISEYMTINKSLDVGKLDPCYDELEKDHVNDASNGIFNKFAKEFNKQPISINTNALQNDTYAKVNEYNIDKKEEEEIKQATYTNVMYFAESSSNTTVNQSKKIATVGKYRFITYTNANNSTAQNQQYERIGGDVLLGERIPTTAADNNSQCVIEALNVTGVDTDGNATPVKLFAVVYLSDKNGNPIDIYGRKISGIDEATEPSEKDIPTLVVINMSSIDVDTSEVPSVSIENYVDTLNFYTNSAVAKEIGGVEFSDGFINRNDHDSNVFGDVTLTESELAEVQNFLKLKLLKNYNFELVVSSFELDSTGSKVDPANGVKNYQLKDIYGKAFKEPIQYTIDTDYNMQWALNQFKENSDAWKLNLPDGVQCTSEEALVDDLGNVEGFKYIIKSTADEFSTGTISLKVSDSEIPYSPSLNVSNTTSGDNKRSNWTTVTYAKLEVEDVQIDTTINNVYNELYAKYSVSSKNDNHLAFGIKNNTSWEPYTLNITSGNVVYSYKTNLIVKDENGNASVNLNVVDCSQAVLGSETDGLDQSGNFGTEDTSDSANTYQSIYEYVNFHLQPGTGISITYTNAIGGIRLTNGAIFTNEYDKQFGDYIYFGSKKFAIDKVLKIVNINGYEVPVEQNPSNSQQWQIVLDNTKIYPLVSGSLVDGKMVIFGEEFKITNSQIKGYSIIVEGEDTATTGNTINLSAVADYIPSDYLGSGPNNGTLIEIDNDNNTAYPTFKKGKEGGIPVYLLVNFDMINDGTGYTYHFTRIIEYNLVQNPIVLKAYQTVGQATSENSGSNRYVIDLTNYPTASRELKIGLGIQSNNYISVTDGQQTDLFEFIKNLKVTGRGVNDIEIKDGYIVVSLQKHFVQITPINISFEYPYYDDQYETFTYYLQIQPDFNFELKEEISDKDDINNDAITELKSTTNGYKFIVKSGAEFANIADSAEVKSWLSKYFNISSDITGIKLQVESGGVYLEENKLVDKFGATNNHAVTFTPLEFVSGGKTYATDIVIQVEIIPACTISSINNQTIYDGTQLYGSVITGAEDYEGLDIVITNTSGLLEDNGVQIANGVVKLNKTQEGDVTLTLDVKYKGVTLISALSVKIIGVEIGYSTIGNISEIKDSDKTILTSDISIAIEEGLQFNVDNYFTASHTTTSTITTGVTIKVALEQIESSNKYYIMYQSENGNVKVNTGYVLTIHRYTIEDKKYSPEGLVSTAGETWNGDNLTIYVHNKEIQVANYLSANCGDVIADTDISVSAVLIDKDNLRNQTTGYIWLDTVTPAKGSQTYIVVYKVTESTATSVVTRYVATDKTITFVVADVELKCSQSGNVSGNGSTLVGNVTINVNAGEFELSDYLSITSNNDPQDTVEIVLLDDTGDIVETPTILEGGTTSYFIGYKVNGNLVNTGYTLIINAQEV